ncbi:hypothetical protein ACFL0D_06110 [Thermoproteota archaeon]
MFKLVDKLFIGNEQDCFFAERTNWAVIHACKHLCHQQAVGYKGNLPDTHPNYLTLERGNHLFLNMIDPHIPLFKQKLFDDSLTFIQKHIEKRNVLIHCNLGFSRAPSIALIWLAKRTEIISDDSFQAALNEFREMYPLYQPGRGIVTYLSTMWDKIN